MTRILTFAGSARKNSLNKSLARAASKLASAAGAEATFVDLADYPMPLYDGDLEDAEGVPKPALDLAELMLAHDGFLIASPEYNSSITPLLKNTIDWVSRTGKAGGPGLGAFEGKAVGLLAASPGGLGGIRSLVHLRSILGNIGAVVASRQQAVPGAFDVFAEDGSIKDEKVADKVKGLVEHLIDLATKLRG